MIEQGLDVTETTADGATVIVVVGEVDVATKSALQDPLEARLDQGEANLTVDLRGVTFIDSTGLGVLVASLKRCRDAGGDLRLVVDTPRILQLLEITGLRKTFSIVDSA
ncbi:MAG: STAS domain-containing protein [Acidimicrobiales bacterium]